MNGQTATITYTASKGTLASTTPYDNGVYGTDFKVMSGNTDVTSNYTLGTQTKGKLTITDRTEKYEIEVVANSNTGNVYDGTEKSATGFETLTFTVEGNTYTVSGLTTSDPASTNVCSLTNAISGTAVVKDAAGNDVTAQFDVTTTDGTLEILPAAITIKADDKTKVYDNDPTTDPALTATVTGVPANGDAPVYSLSREPGQDVDDYTITVTAEAASNPNYTVTVQSGIFSITPVTTQVAVTIVGAIDTATYDGVAHSVNGYTISIDNELYTVNDFTKPDQDATVATATRTDYGTTNMALSDANFANISNNFSNVVFNVTPGHQTIEKREITFTANSTSVDYDGAEHTYAETATPYYTISGDGLAANQNVCAITLTGAGTIVGEYPINITAGSVHICAANQDDVTPNYIITLEPGTLTIEYGEPIAITITANSDSKTYDGTALTADGYTIEYTWGGTDYSVNVGTDGIHEFPNGDKITVNVDGTRTFIGDTANVPTVVSILHGTNDVHEAYAVTKNNGTLSITSRTLTIKAASDNKIYDGTPLTNSNYEVINGTSVASTDHIENVTVTGSQTDVGTSNNVPSQTVIVRNADGEEVTFNYTISYQNGTLTVTEDMTNITITSATHEWPYDGATHTDPTYTVVYGNTTLTPVEGSNGLRFALNVRDTLIVTPTFNGITYVGENAANNNVYDYTLQHADNYGGTITTNYGTLSITPVTLTVTAASDSKVYDGTALTNSNATAATLIGTDVLASWTNTGSQTVVGSSNNVPSNAKIENAAGTDITSSYTISYVNGTLTVTKAPADSLHLTCPAVANTTKMYDGSVLNPAASASGILATDVIKIEYSIDGGAWSTDVPSITHVDTIGVSVRATHADYDTAYCDYTLSITKRTVVMTSADSTKVYDGTALTNNTVTVTGDGFVSGEGATYNVTGTQTNIGSSENTFTYTLNSNTSAGDYTITTVNGTLKVTKAPADSLHLTCPAVANTTKMYDGVTMQPAANASGILTTDVIKIEYSIDGGVWSTDVPSLTHVDTIAVDVRASSPNYDTAYCDYTLSITKRTVVMTSADSTKVYDGTPLTNSTVTLTGDDFISGEGYTTNVTGSQTNIGSSANTFTYTLNNGTLADDYCISTVNGTLTVTKAPADSLHLTCPAVANTTKMYDGNALNPAATAQGIQTTDVITIEYSVDGGAWNTTVPSITHVGTVDVDVRATNPNYDTATCNYTLTVTCRTITLTSATDSKVYNGTPLTNSTVTLTGDGFISGEGYTTDVTGTQTNVGSSENTFTYTLNEGTLADDYCIETANGTLTVTKAPADSLHLTCPAVANTTKMYDGNALNPAATAQGIVANDVIKIEYRVDGGAWSEAVPSITHVGSVDVDVRATNPNYDTATCNYTLTVTCRTITLTSATDSKVYNGTPLTNSTVTLTGDGFISGEGYTTDVTGTQTNVGSSANTFTYTLNEGTLVDDYCIETANGTLTVTKAPADSLHLTCPAVANTTKMYDGTALNPAATAQGIVANDVIKVEYSVDGGAWVETVPSITHVGTVDVDVRATNPNYDTATCAYTLTVTCRNITLTSATDEKVYDATPLTNSTVTLTGDGFISGEGYTTNVTGSQTNVGSSDNTFTYTLNNGTQANDYCIETVKGTLTVTPAALTITAKDQSYVYNGLAQGPAGTYTTGFDTYVTVEGLKGNDALTSITLAGSKTNVGTYTDEIVPSAAQIGNNTGNYNITYVEGDLTITKRSLTITINDTKVYDGTPLVTNYNSTAVTTIGLQNNATLTAGVVTTPSKDVNTYTDNTGANITTAFATSDGISNYDVHYNFTQTITKRDLLITVNDTKVYDGTPLVTNYNNTTAVTATGLQNGATLTAGQVTSSSKDVGVYEYTGTTAPTASDDMTITTAFATIDGISNYNVSYDFTQEITPADLVITINDAKVYDGTPLVTDYTEATATGLQNNATLTAGVVTTPSKDVNTYTDNTGANITTAFATSDGISNYNVSYDFTQEITPRDLTITIGNDTKVYDGTPLVTSYDNATVTVEGLQNGAELTAGEVTSNSANAGTYTYTGATAPTADDDMTITTPFETSDGISNYNVTYNFTQTITRKNAEIDIMASKIYDGTPLVVNYNDATVTVTGLVDGDALNAGKATTAVGTEPSYKVGTYTYNYTPSMMSLSFAPVEGTVLLDPEFNTINGIENYNMTYALELDITLRTLDITAADAEKVYDGTPLTSTDYTIAAVDGLADGDEIATIMHGGSITCVGSIAHTVESAVIMKDGTEDVTDQYTIIYHNGTLTVTNHTDFTCPTAEDITLDFGECETEYTLQGTPDVGTGMTDGTYTITNDLATQNPLTVGTHTITWTLSDACGNIMATCEQTVTVNYPECPNATDADGNTYVGVRIGCDCWTQTNLRSETYADGTTAIPDVMTYHATPYYNNEAANLETYGHLYTWQAAIKDGSTNAYGHVPGICPTGWYLPTKEQYDGLSAYGPDALRAESTLWADGGGTNTTGFTGLPGGRYVGNIDRYRDMTLMDYYWATTTDSAGNITATEVELTVNCLRVKEVLNTNPNGYSIRCVKEREN